MNDDLNYSLFDRSLHKLSFSSNVLQELLSDLENGLYKKNWENIKVTSPIFVTSLPRAGTTILLEALTRIQGMASHTYRDMPFVLTPFLWKKLSRIVNTEGKIRERAHGDGLGVSEDSPEAFEEIIWKKHFPKNYTQCGISIDFDYSSKFSDFFCDHVKKIISIRSKEDFEGRYVSKNNANIVRVETIRNVFPDACIVVPVRRPADHAISLWQQHQNFINQHENNVFTERYMSDLGHYEFGNLHRPILFPEFDSRVSHRDPMKIDYWLAYWIVAFSYLAETKNIHFQSFESLCTDSGSEFENCVERSK